VLQSAEKTWGVGKDETTGYIPGGGKRRSGQNMTWRNQASRPGCGPWLGYIHICWDHVKDRAVKDLSPDKTMIFLLVKITSTP
jgi:hypothetical protein